MQKETKYNSNKHFESLQCIFYRHFILLINAVIICKDLEKKSFVFNSREKYD